MKPFEYYTPTKVFFGKDRQQEIGRIIKEFGFRKILLHYGGGSIKKNGIYDTVVRSLREEGIDFVEMGGVTPNPKLSKVLETVELCRTENVEMILAVGGGSVLDSAKLAASGALVDCNPWLFSLKEKVPQKALPIGVIPTIASAGSEMSSSCVITNDETSIKRGFDSPFKSPALCRDESRTDLHGLSLPYSGRRGGYPDCIPWSAIFSRNMMRN